MKKSFFHLQTTCQRLSGSATAMHENHPQISQISQIGTTALNLRNL